MVKIIKGHIIFIKKIIKNKEVEYIKYIIIIWVIFTEIEPYNTYYYIMT